MNSPGEEENNRQESGEGFVRERIVNRPSRKRILRKLLVTGVCGILFGLTAGIALAAVFPAASGWFAPEETSPSITIPKDTQEASRPEQGRDDTESGSETEAAPDGTDESTEGESSTEETAETEGMSDDEIRRLIAKMLDDALDEYSSDVSSAKSMYHAMAALGKTYNAAVVTIVIRDLGTDWFENEVETSGECAGIIWNEAEDGSLYILSGAAMPGDGAEFQVIFNDGSRRDAVLCQTDGQTSLMVLKVAAGSVDEQLRAKIQVLPLGNSYTVTKGLPVLVIGSPVGDVGAIIPAVVTYTDGTFAGADSIYRKMYLDCASADGTNGFVVSLEGEILGIITPETSGSVTGMIGISDLKGVLELLANGQRVPYLGIMGQSVTDELQQIYGLPAGVYVSDVIPDSPAYQAGIKAGDVVVRIGAAEISTIRGMKNNVEGLQAGTEVPVTVKRAGNGEYQELQFTVVPGLR